MLQIQIPKIGLFRLFILFLFVYVSLSLLLVVIGPHYIKMIMPLMFDEIKLIHPEYQILKYQYDDKRKIITYDIVIQRNLFDKNKLFLGSGARVTKSTYASVLYIQPIILFSLILVWPIKSIKQKVRAIVISIPLLLFIASIDFPVHVICRCEEDIINLGIITWWSKMRIFWWEIMNNGGRQILALLAFAVAYLGSDIFRKRT